MKRTIVMLAACLTAAVLATGCRTPQGGVFEDDYDYDTGRYDRMNDYDPARPNPDANPVLDRAGPDYPQR